MRRRVQLIVFIPLFSCGNKSGAIVEDWMERTYIPPPRCVRIGIKIVSRVMHFTWFFRWSPSDRKLLQSKSDNRDNSQHVNQSKQVNQHSTSAFLKTHDRTDICLFVYLLISSLPFRTNKYISSATFFAEVLQHLPFSCYHHLLTF